MKKKEILLEKLDSELNQYRKKTFEELLQFIDKEPIIFEGKLNNEFFQIEINVFFEDTTKNSIIVSGSIDNGGWRSFLPYSISFGSSKL